jgi:hypothetical protein
MIAIYSNNQLTDHYICQLKFSQQYQVYHSIDRYVAATADVKIAFVNHLNSFEPPESEQQRLQQVVRGHNFSQEIDQVRLCSNFVFAFENELHVYHQELFQRHNQPNVYWIVPGQINDPDTVDQQNVILGNSHFQGLLYPYLTFPAVTISLQKLQHNTVKPLWFDVLLGQPRPHRDFVYDLFVDHNLQHSSILTYQNIHYTDDFKTRFVWESDIQHFPATTTRSTDSVIYHGHELALSRILPVEIYNQTAYSVVAETGHNNWYSFFTEKTAKPMMARRLFVMFSGYKFLENLRQLGFQTFSNVIDESYDLIPDNQQRWLAAFEQVQRLRNMDQLVVFKKITSTVEHNYQLLMNTNWDQYMLAQLQQKLNNSI